MFVVELAGPFDQVRDVSIGNTFQSWHWCKEDDLFSLD